MRLTTKELHLILGAIDTHRCELEAQDDIGELDSSEHQHAEELNALDNISNKIGREINRREKAAE
jgi:hypothetical protein